jgi:hypothetical protein
MVEVNWSWSMIVRFYLEGKIRIMIELQTDVIVYASDGFVTKLADRGDDAREGATDDASSPSIPADSGRQLVYEADDQRYRPDNTSEPSEVDAEASDKCGARLLLLEGVGGYDRSTSGSRGTFCAGVGFLGRVGSMSVLESVLGHFSKSAPACSNDFSFSDLRTEDVRASSDFRSNCRRIVATTAGATRRTWFTSMTRRERENTKAITMPIATRGIGFSAKTSRKATVSDIAMNLDKARYVASTSPPRVWLGRNTICARRTKSSTESKRLTCATALDLANATMRALDSVAKRRGRKK